MTDLLEVLLPKDVEFPSLAAEPSRAGRSVRGDLAEDLSLPVGSCARAL